MIKRKIVCHRGSALFKIFDDGKEQKFYIKKFNKILKVLFTINLENLLVLKIQILAYKNFPISSKDF